MFYSKAVTIAANTTQANATRTELFLDKGVIHRIEVQFPKGCNGLVHVQLLYAEEQFWPNDLEENIASDGETVAWNEFFEITDAPKGVVIRAWNDDEDFEHKITVRVAVLPKSVLLPTAGTEGFLQAIRSLFRR